MLKRWWWWWMAGECSMEMVEGGLGLVKNGWLG